VTVDPTVRPPLDLHITVHEGGPHNFVLVHGSMDREGGFARLVKFLRPHGRVTTYDRRGYGRSLSATGARDLAAHIDDLGAIIGDRPSIVIGHSLGGSIALGFATRVPHLVTGLVVYESPMSWEPWWSRDTGGAAAARAATPEDAAEAFLRRFVGDERWERLPQRTKDARRAEGGALRDETMSLRSGCPWGDRRLACPIVSGAGDRSRDDFRRSAEVVSSLSDDGRQVTLLNAHHNAHSADPQQFYEKLVKPIIDRIETGSWSG